MRAALKCVHPLLLAGAGLFLLPFLALPVGAGDIIPASKVGPCSVPVFLLFVPGEIMGPGPWIFSDPGFRISC